MHDVDSLYYAVSVCTAPVWCRYTLYQHVAFEHYNVYMRLSFQYTTELIIHMVNTVEINKNCVFVNEIIALNFER